ncbi:hypothetical protein [Psychroflexus maritimus]|uniref:WG containing repeat-containing protein n=1 Tax=Psychroflexus maritimus TaxID=2714865 RepID=A0A967E044_9FLAO|nr:hypothetical protein [Psychroflexus maritimus]NGZ90202.1 hypothetical protein [Psychroflexus maritimus]
MAIGYRFLEDKLMIINGHIILIIVVFLVTNVKAQVIFYDEKTGEEYQITPQTDEKLTKAFLDDLNARAIEFNPNTSSRFPLRLKNKKSNWVLFDSYEDDLFLVNEAKKYSFQFPSPLLENRGFTLAFRKDKIYYTNLQESKVITKMSFTQVVPRTITGTFMVENPEGELKEEQETSLESFTVKNGVKWGLIEMASDNIYLSRNFLYNSSEEVPEATGFQSYQLEMMENLREVKKLDLLVALDENGYYFKARDKKTKLFGLYAGERMPFNQIPAKYDDIKRHRNPETYEVWKNGKVGYYNGNFDLVMEPIYDDFKFVHLDYTFGCALKKNGKWELYNAHEPKKLVEGNAKTIDELIELWLNR